VLARIVAVAAWTAAGLAILLVGMWLTARSPAGQRRWRTMMVRRWARGICRIAGARIAVTGPVPRAPFFLVANHLSYVDIVVLLALVDGVFVAKRELDRWPVVGYLTRLVGIIFLDRTSPRDAFRALGAIDARIAGGDGVIVFPEGTSSGGDDVKPMKPALFEWAARNQFPVHCVTLGYETPPGWPRARSAVCWWGDMSFIPHVIRLCRLPHFRATAAFADESLIGSDRNQLAADARAAIVARFRSHST
jgi:1-acyl-sn-glycerol-3-phosphate acyltransferase